MPTTIKYKGATIAELEAGKIGTIACNGKEMEDDLIVIAPDSEGGGSNETDIFALQTLSGFASSEDFMGLYVWQTTPAPFSLTAGKTYFVVWDGTTYECVAQDASAMNNLSGTVGLGDLTEVGGAGNGEPFIVGYIPKTDYVGFISFDTKTEHTVRIYQKASATSTDERVKYVTFMNGATELISYPVIVGDTVKNPATAGLIDTPAKEPTTSTVYTFSGWSLTEGGAADSAALANVTEDRIVYAAFTESARLYTVNFYDGDTLVNTEQVAYGGSSTYIYGKDDYIFTGWQPEPTNITGDLDCYAQWIEGVDTFANTSWSKISQVAELGVAADYWSVGDTKTATINGATATIEIIGFNADDKADGTGKAGITMWVRNLADVISATATAYGTETYEWDIDWRQHSSYAPLLTLFDTFEDDLAAVVKTVNKNVNRSSKAAHTVFPISMKELGYLSIEQEINSGITAYEKFSENTSKSIGSVYEIIDLNVRYYLRDCGTETTYPYIVDHRTSPSEGGNCFRSSSGKVAYPSICFCI